ncbi:MAG TPA: S41 family peptidase, partial [Blastocatellia bacterium]
MRYLSNSTPFTGLIAILILHGGASAQMPGGGPDMSIDAKTKADTIQELIGDIKNSYVFPDVAGKLAKMLEDRQARGEYNSITSAREFSNLLTNQMLEVAHDKHLRVLYSAMALPPMPPMKPGDEPKPDPRMLMMQKTTNYGFEEIKHLSGNVGYLKLNGFMDAERGGGTAAAAMAFLANTDALIIDLRENHGGVPGMVDLLASYLFSGERPVHLNDLEFRKPGTTDYELTQWWTLPY